MTALATAPGPSASLRVARLMAVSLGIAGIMLFVLDVQLVVAQTQSIALWWTVGSAVAVVGASVAVGVVGVVGSTRATRISFLVLAGSLLVPALLIFLAAAPGSVAQQPWLADLAVIGAAAAGAGLPLVPAIAYVILLDGSFALAALVLVDPALRQSSLMHLCQTLFYMALFTALAIASRRAGDALDIAVRSAVVEVSAAAAAEARRAQRRRVEGLIHDSLIVALLAFGRGAPEQDERAAREALRALRAIEEVEEPPGPVGDPTPVELAWRLQALTTELDTRIRFDYTAGKDGRLPAGVAAAIAEAMSEAVRNSLRHGGPPEHVARQVSADIGADAARVIVLDDGAGFEPAMVEPTRLGIRQGIEHRMALVGGRARVLSRPGRGTTVVLDWSSS